VLSIPHGKLFIDNDLVLPEDAVLSFKFLNEKGEAINKKISIRSPQILENIFNLILSPKRLMGSNILQLDSFRFHINEKPFLPNMKTYQGGVQGVEGVYTNSTTKETERVNILINGIPYTSDWFSKIDNILSHRPYRVKGPQDGGSYETVQVLGTEGNNALVATIDDLLLAQKNKGGMVKIFKIPKEKVDIEVSGSIDLPSIEDSEKILGTPYLRITAEGKTSQAQYDSIYQQVFSQIELYQEQRQIPGFLQRCREFFQKISKKVIRSIEKHIEDGAREL
jgi:hypothetical protein